MPEENTEQLKRLIELLREHPEWQAALRDILFPQYSPATVQELLHELIHQVRSLAEAQRHTEAYVQALAEAQKRTEAEVRALAEAQRRSDERLDRLEATVAELAEAQKRTEAELAQFRQETQEEFKRVWAAIRELTEAQKRTEAELAQFRQETQEELKRVWAAIRELTEAQKRTEAELAQFRQETQEEFKRVWAAIRELAEAQKRLEERVSAEFERVWAAIEELTKSIQHLADEQSAMRVRLGTLSGWYAESIFRDRAPAYLGPKGFLRVRVVPKQTWVRHLEDAYEAGRISAEEWQDILQADAVVRARKNGETVYLIVEVSYTVDEHDVERAVRRARIWSRLIPDTPTIPLVAGVVVGEDVLKVAKIEDVAVVEMPTEG